ncbi:MAG: hypothetical protein WCV68_03970 [Candidatus Paceibacterota bacterium]
MEELPLKDSSISRIVGRGELLETEETFLPFMAGHFKERGDVKGQNGEIIKEYEVSPLVEKMVEKISVDLPIFLKEYGLKSYLPVGVNNFHLVDLDDFKAKNPSLNDFDSFGVWDSKYQRVILFLGEGSSTMVSAFDLVSVVSHEIIHGQSFGSLNLESWKENPEDGRSFLWSMDAIDPGEATPGFIGLSQRRGGLTMFSHDGEITYFRGLNEAVTQELTLRFSREFIPEHLVVNGLPVTPDYAIEKIEEGAGLVYKKNREKLWQIIDDIFSASSGRFEDREEVFKIFTEAYLNGDVLFLAKLVESTYGKGSFRRLGEETEDPKVA